MSGILHLLAIVAKWWGEVFVRLMEYSPLKPPCRCVGHGGLVVKTTRQQLHNVGGIPRYQDWISVAAKAKCQHNRSTPGNLKLGVRALMADAESECLGPDPTMDHESSSKPMIGLDPFPSVSLRTPALIFRLGDGSKTRPSSNQVDPLPHDSSLRYLHLILIVFMTSSTSHMYETAGSRTNSMEPYAALPEAEQRRSLDTVNYVIRSDQ